MQMQILVILLATLLTRSHGDLARFGNCHVILKSDDMDSISVISKGKTLWSSQCNSDLLMVHKVAGSNRFFVLAPPVSVALFNTNGTLIRNVPLQSERAPRPFLYSNRYLVWGADIFNWLKFDSYNFQWQAETRKFYSMDLSNGALRGLPGYKTTGLPLAIFNNNLFTIAPVNWSSNWHYMRSWRLIKQEMRIKGGTSKFWLRDLSLNGGKSRKIIVRLSKHGGVYVFNEIAGWDDWKVMASVLSRKANYITIAGDRWGRNKVKIKVPAGWLR